MSAAKLSRAEATVLVDLVLVNQDGTVRPSPGDSNVRRVLEALLAHRYIECRYTGLGSAIALSATLKGRLRILNPEKL